MREQLLAADVAALDAVIWTHDHADHCHGIDDLRQVFHAMGKPVRGLARRETLTALETRFAYAFRGRTAYPPTIAAEELNDRFTIDDISIRVVDQPHGNITSAGLRFDVGGRSIGYATDFHELTEPMRNIYAGIDLWIVDALRHAPHPSHPTVASVLAWVDELKPARAILIHMDHSMDYAALRHSLPTGVEPGYDGQVIEL